LSIGKTKIGVENTKGVLVTIEEDCVTDGETGSEDGVARKVFIVGVKDAIERTTEDEVTIGVFVKDVTGNVVSAGVEVTIE